MRRDQGRALRKMVIADKSAPKVAVLGLWHQGLVAAACIADAGYEVVGADPTPGMVADLNAGRLPVAEPGLDGLVACGISGGRLAFEEDPAQAVEGAEFIFVSFDTPVDADDQSDLSGIFKTMRSIAPKLPSGTVVLVTAQVRVGTCAELLACLKENGAGEVTIAYSPENLRLGQAIERFKAPPLPVIGTNDSVTFDRLATLLAPFSDNWQQTTLATAEMLKHALNGFLGASICFANELGNLCDSVGADGGRIAELLRLEPRVGPKAMLMPGLGFSGGTLARDMVTLRELGDEAGIDTPLLDGAWTSNGEQNKTVVRRLASLLPDLGKARICVLGLTYKPYTSTLRRSAALEVIEALAASGATVAAHDPGANLSEVAGHDTFVFHDDVDSAVCGADAMVLMTPWLEYKSIDFEHLRGLMRGNLVFDTAQLWRPDDVLAQGFDYIDIGRGRGRAVSRQVK